MPELNLQQAQQNALTWARKAGAIARQRFGKVKATRKSDLSLVTEVDVQMERMIIKGIRQLYPTHGIIGEEDAAADSAGPPPLPHHYCWVIDPLDGTRNLVRGFPCFSVVIALMHADFPVMGVIHDPLCGWDFTAIRGQGAYWNDRLLAVSNQRWHHDTMIGIPTGKSMDLPPAIYSDWLKRAVLRNTGSTALHLALVAAGALDACYGQKAKLWDVAAGALMIQEAGGTFTSHQGQPIFPLDPSKYQGQDLIFLAGGTGIYADLLQTLL